MWLTLWWGTHGNVKSKLKTEHNLDDALIGQYILRAFILFFYKTLTGVPHQSVVHNVSSISIIFYDPVY